MTRMRRVEMWRGGCRSNISVAAPFVWRCLTGSAVAPFPHPLALRPAHSRGHQVVTAIRRLQPFRYLHDCSDCFRLERNRRVALRRGHVNRQRMRFETVAADDSDCPLRSGRCAERHGKPEKDVLVRGHACWARAGVQIGRVVLKELVDNALDSGAQEVTLTGDANSCAVDARQRDHIGLWQTSKIDIIRDPNS